MSSNAIQTGYANGPGVLADQLADPSARRRAREGLRLGHRGPMPGTVLPRLNMHAAKALSNCAWIDAWVFVDWAAANPAPPSAPLAAPIPAPRPPPIAPPNPAPRAVVSAAVPSPRRLAPCAWSATACWANCRHVA